MKKPTPMPEYNWTIAEVADRCRVTQDCVRKWLTRGELGFIKAGARTLIPESELQKFLDKCTKKAHSTAA